MQPAAWSGLAERRRNEKSTPPPPVRIRWYHTRVLKKVASALKEGEADGLVMSRELHRKTADLAEQREAALARVSASLRGRYEVAVRKGLHPALAAVRDGRCSVCGSAVPDVSRRRVQDSLRVVPCSGCLPLLYDRGWTERDLMPSTLRPTARAKP